MSRDRLPTAAVYSEQRVCALANRLDASATGAKAKGGEDILLRMSDAYRSMAKRFTIRASVETRIQLGGRFKTGPRASAS